MSTVLLSLEIRAEPDVVRVRQRARQLATLFGFDLQDQTRIATAASEVARNAYQYARGGTAQFSVEGKVPAAFFIRVSDSGPGIANLPAILAGQVKSRTGLGVGLIGSKKLMDDVWVDTSASKGTTVEMRKALPEQAPRVTPELLTHVERELSRPGLESPFDEVRRQNQELIRALAELKDHQAELARINRSLQDRFEFEQYLVGIVSHDLRNPLSAMVTSASVLIHRGDLDEKQTKTAARIVSSGNRAERMIRDLLDFTQARIGGGIPVQRSSLDLHAVARQIVDEIQAAHLEHQIQLEQSGDGHGEGDSDRLAQVLTNLVHNAIKYSLPGTSVRVASRGTGDSLVLRVHNEGPPIPPETAAVLFQPMRRGNQHAERGRQGLGLGLFIVSQIVAAHEGTVDCQSSEAEGTVFTVTLPRHSLENEAGPQSSARVAPT
jgi:signal transduction histidine kinase